MAYRQTFIRIFFFAALILILNFAHKEQPSLNALNVLPASRLIKVADDPTVYYVNQYRLKLPVPSAKVFLSYGAKWTDIEVVPRSELDFYKNAEYIKLEGNARVYQLKDGIKRYLTPKAASALKILPEEVIPVNRTEFNAYASGQTLDENEAVVLRAEKDAMASFTERDQTCVPDDSVGGENGCRIFEAMGKKDPTLCSAITLEEWKAKCYAAVPPQSGDVLANCKKLTDTNLVDMCVSQIALAKNNSLLCTTITDPAKKQFCESGIKISVKDITACDSLPLGDGETGKNICLFTYAISNGDTRACEKISVNSAFKQPCNNVLNQQSSMEKKLKSNWFASAVGRVLPFVFGKSASAQTNPTNIPVGGRFLPGLYDIYTPTIICGIQVSVAGPRPGVFTWLPIRIYDYFPKASYHVGLNMLGLAKLSPPCPPTLFMLGSSLTPGL